MRRLVPLLVLLLGLPLAAPLAGSLPASATPLHEAAPSAALAAAVPRTVPALRRWQPATGSFRLADRPRIVLPRDYAARLATTARVLTGDLHRLTGRTVDIRVGVTPRAGDVVLALGLTQAVGREGYRMAVGGTVRISGRTDAGVFYGTRSLLQLLHQSRSIPAGTALDWPRYPERGLLLDLGRVPFKAAYLRHQVRELAYLKLNVLHLHLSDNNAFRIESDRHPEIVSPVHLSKAQVRSLVALAKRYHVTVVPEIDIPGHMGAILHRHPEFQLKNAFGVADETRLDLTNPAARAFVRDLIDELLPLFPGRSWHLGADEYIKSAEYLLYPTLATFAVQKYGVGAVPKDALHGFVNDLAAFVRARGKTARIYNDDAGGGSAVRLDPRIVVEWWTDFNPVSDPLPPSPEQLRADGHRVLNMGWWPNYYNTPGLPAPSLREEYDTWDPHQFCGTLYLNSTIRKPCLTLPPGDRGNLGAKVAVWGDGPMTSPDEIAAGLLPRLQVLSQKAWLSPQPASYDAFLARTAVIGHAPQP